MMRRVVTKLLFDEQVDPEFVALLRSARVELRLDEGGDARAVML